MTPTTGTTPGTPDVAGTAPVSTGHGNAGPDAQPQVSPSRSLLGKDGERGASDAPAAPPVTEVLEVRGNCPMGCGPTLFCARPDGAVLCNNTSCPRPSAADEILGDSEAEHVVILGEDDFTVRHPLRERLDDELLSCSVHARLRASAGPPRQPGTYRLTTRGRRTWSWEAIA